MRCRPPDDGLAATSGWKIRGTGLGAARQARPHPVELRRVDRRQVHVGDPHRAAVVEQLGAQRLREPDDGGLRAAVGRLQRDRAVRECRADLHDRAVAACAHVSEGGQRAVDVAQIGDVGDAADLCGGQLGDRREDRHHGVVDPHADRPEFVDDRGRGGVDRVGVGDIDGDDERAAAGRGYILGGSVEPVTASGQQRDRPSPLCERDRGGTADARAASGDDDASGACAHDDLLPTAQPCNTKVCCCYNGKEKRPWIGAAGPSSASWQLRC